MSEVDEIANWFNKLEKQVNCFTPPSIPEYLTPKLDFDIDPNKFIEWLKAEDKSSGFLYIDGDSYAEMVSNMCEYSCLYVAMLLHDKPLKGKLTIICGNFGWWEHFWLKYTVDGEEFYIDLTLQQFIPEAPKLAISKAINVPAGYNCNFDSDGISIKDYIEDKRAFQFYVHPK